MLQALVSLVLLRRNALSSYQPGCTLRTHCNTARGAARFASDDCTPARLCVTRGCGARAQRFLDLARGVDGVG